MSSTPSQDDWIRVTSRDGFSFIVKRSVVFRSGTLRNMLDERRTSLPAPPFTPHVHATHLSPKIASRRPYKKAAVTEKFVEYLAYKATYENVSPNEEIPDFIERIAPEIALELLSAADYLEGAFLKLISKIVRPILLSFSLISGPHRGTSINRAVLSFDLEKNVASNL
ncbi:hypothetical protein DFH94DRAFT_690008 [Russula ochroleuca]|uniref:Elongin-C n=1 Tax=Russula ochroleuca TaxID=152965 RepID=A0A9P5N0P5_9AGAM|nr:hypothetical protein DFH94DRAFT_690008 [Russula ochroleuca]